MLVPVSIPVRVVEEWCPPDVITWEFDAVFRRTSEGGVVFNVSPVTKVTVQKQNKRYTPGCALVGGVLPKGCVLSHASYTQPVIFNFQVNS